MKNLLYLVAIVMVFLLIGTAGGVDAGSVNTFGFIARLVVFGSIGLGSVLTARRI